MTNDFDDVLLSLRNELTRSTCDQFGLAEAQATELGEWIVAWLQERFGGREVYIRARQREERDRAVLADYHGGMGRDEVCKKHGISRATFYAILQRS